MANLRNLKKEIDYRLEEFVFDCEMAIYFQPNKEDEVVKLMEKAVELPTIPTSRRTHRSCASTMLQCAAIWSQVSKDSSAI